MAPKLFSVGYLNRLRGAVAALRPLGLCWTLGEAGAGGVSPVLRPELTKELVPGVAECVTGGDIELCSFSQTETRERRHTRDAVCHTLLPPPPPHLPGLLAAGPFGQPQAGCGRARRNDRE